MPKKRIGEKASSVCSFDPWETHKESEGENMIIQVTNFNSSNVERFDYDSATQTLTVQFKSSKKRYVYKNVHKPALYEMLHAAIDDGSVGGVVSNKIKNHFDCEIEEDFLS